MVVQQDGEVNMGDLVSRSLNTQSDPALVLQQALANREKQYSSIQNPQQQLAARLGGMLGGGLVNLAQDRGFFEINDPLLNKVSQIQGIYNEVAGRVDPTADPARFYSELQSAYSNAGLGREALAASQEAQKAKGSAFDLQLKETQVLEKNPELIAGRIEEALKAGNEPEAMRLANLKTRLDETKGLEVEKTKADIDRIKAQTREAQERIESGKFDWKVVNNAAGAPIGVQTINKKTGEIQFKEVDPEIAKKFLDFGGSKPADNKGGEKKDRVPLNSFAANTTPNAAPSASSVLSQDSAKALMMNQPNAQPTINWGARLQQMNNVTTPTMSSQQRDLAIQAAFPNAVVRLLNEEQKQVLAQQIGL